MHLAAFAVYAGYMNLKEYLRRWLFVLGTLKFYILFHFEQILFTFNWRIQNLL